MGQTDKNATTVPENLFGGGDAAKSFAQFAESIMSKMTPGSRSGAEALQRMRQIRKDPKMSIERKLSELASVVDKLKRDNPDWEDFEDRIWEICKMLMLGYQIAHASSIDEIEAACEELPEPRTLVCRYRSYKYAVSIVHQICREKTNQLVQYSVKRKRYERDDDVDESKRRKV
jgi:hypothetical protein